MTFFKRPIKKDIFAQSETKARMSMCLVSTQHTLRNSVGWVYITFKVCRLNRVKVNGGPKWVGLLIALSIEIFRFVTSFWPYVQKYDLLSTCIPLFENWCTYLKLFTVIIFIRHYANLAFLRQLKSCSFTSNVVEYQL